MRTDILSDYNIQERPTLPLILHLCGGMQIFVKTLTSRWRLSPIPSITSRPRFRTRKGKWHAHCHSPFPDICRLAACEQTYFRIQHSRTARSPTHSASPWRHADLRQDSLGQDGQGRPLALALRLCGGMQIFVKTLLGKTAKDGRSLSLCVSVEACRSSSRLSWARRPRTAARSRSASPWRHADLRQDSYGQDDQGRPLALILCLRGGMQIFVKALLGKTTKNGRSLSSWASVEACRSSSVLPWAR